MHGLSLRTPRLHLIAITATSAAAAINDRVRFARELNADIPASWPPETLADVQQLLATRLEDRPDETGWWGWYIIANPGVVAEPATLIGSAGCTRWGPSGLPQFGYGLLPEFFRQGFATEAAMALIQWVIAQPGVTRIEATTFERHTPSIKILERCGFQNHGVSPDDQKAVESDRQGRGKLLLFVREAPSLKSEV